MAVLALRGAQIDVYLPCAVRKLMCAVPNCVLIVRSVARQRVRGVSRCSGESVILCSQCFEPGVMRTTACSFLRIAESFEVVRRADPPPGPLEYDSFVKENN